MLMPVWAGREVLGRQKVQDGVSRSATAVLTFIGANLKYVRIDNVSSLARHSSSIIVDQ